MARPKYSPDELQPTGKFYPGASIGGNTLPPIPVLSYPISVRQNYALAVAKKTPYWIPLNGFINSEFSNFRPRINPDNIANHIVMDGEAPIDYSQLPLTIKSDFFDVIYHFENAIGGATVYPGEFVIKEIEHWQDYVKFPDLDKLDWEGCHEANLEYLAGDRINSFGLQYMYWERLMNMYGTMETCIAFVDEDLKPYMHSFLSALYDWYEELITRMKQYNDIQNCYLHDDWCHIRGSFFSNATAREMLLPYIKRTADLCHNLGMYYDVHLCGKVDDIIDVFIDAGCDSYVGQTELNDMDMLIEKYKDRRFLWGVPQPDIPEGAPLSQVRDMAAAWVDKYKNYQVELGSMSLMNTNPDFSSAVYEFSRIAYQDSTDELEVGATV